MSVLGNIVRRGFYLDSVALMRISRNLTDYLGVESAALMIGTAANKALLKQSSLLDDSGAAAGVSDLIVAVRAHDAASLRQAFAHAEALLQGPATNATNDSSLPRARHLGPAIAQLDGANLALISVPGDFAAREARQALQRGLNVMLFSDNVALEQEVVLKHLARERGLLMMGPDCGTCLINGVPIAFANAVPRGHIGIISAAGTGLQEVSTLIARGGAGIAHGIGVGGRDLSVEVNATSTLGAIDALDADTTVQTIVIVSKPPAPAVITRVLERIAESRKPFVVCFIGCDELALPANALPAPTLLAAAERCLGFPIAPDWISCARRSVQPRPGTIRGLFCGGTLCAESQVVVRAAGMSVSSNTPVPGARAWSGTAEPCHLLLDLGADEFTRGRPHPMIEPALRSEWIARALRDPDVAVLLLDVVIGYGAHPDPAGVTAQALTQSAEGNVTVIASVTGTEEDPQCYSTQVAALEQAGVIVAPSNAQAAELAAAAVYR